MRCRRTKLLILVLLFTDSANAVALENGRGPFQRIASFPVFLNSDINDETTAEIVAATDDGMTLVYSNSTQRKIGFVDITDPTNPTAAGVVTLRGEPTSVAVKGKYALTCINTSVDFIDTAGDLVIIDIAARKVIRTMVLGGQPDSIAVSPSGKFAAICIENERDEDHGKGNPPQLPGGFVVVVDCDGPPTNWSTRNVDLTGIPELFPNDPEPEYVDINDRDVAVITCQENNHLVLIDLASAQVIDDYSAGTVDLKNIDNVENDLIEQTANLIQTRREPDAVTWITDDTFVTADEGDFVGGGRGFTLWKSGGIALFTSKNSLENHAARMGHYPESRSEKKGCEPEGIEFGCFGDLNFLFVGSERANLVFVYELRGNENPRFRQALPTGVEPEGLLAIPQRDLFVVANEHDARDDKIRSSIMIYARTNAPTYPTITSSNLLGSHRPIPWGSLSGLAADESGGETRVYTIYDASYKKSRVFCLDVRQSPAVINAEVVLVDQGCVLTDVLRGLKADLPGADKFVVSKLINDDMTVNLDPEGIAICDRGYFYVASEGNGNLVNGLSNNSKHSFASPNLVLKATASGTIVDAILLPLEVTRNQSRFGFEGVAIYNNAIYVAFQRAWRNAGDPAGGTRIGRFDLSARSWTFAYYPLDIPASPAGGWVGLSELTSLGGGNFAVIERDNQGGPDAIIKRLYTFSIESVTFRSAGDAPAYDTISKSLFTDLIADGAYAGTGGLIPEKQEGLVVLGDRTTFIVNDNDGVNDNNGETQLLRLEYCGDIQIEVDHGQRPLN